MDSVEELWAAVLDRWTDEKAHGAFLEYCRRTENLAEAAKRYRIEAGLVSGSAYRDAGHAELAKKKLAAITVIALADLEAKRTDKSAAKTTMLRSMFRWGFVFLVVIGLLVAALESGR